MYQISYLRVFTHNNLITCAAITYLPLCLTCNLSIGMIYLNDKNIFRSNMILQLSILQYYNYNISKGNATNISVIRCFDIKIFLSSLSLVFWPMASLYRTKCL